MYISDLPLPDTSMHVDVFGLEIGNGEHLQDVKESELHSRGFIKTEDPYGKEPSDFSVDLQ